MKIEAVKVEAGKLVFSVSPHEAYKFAAGFTPGEYEITKQKKKRSLTANAYMWVLCDEIGQAVNLPAVEVYRKAIREVGVCKQWDNIPEDAVPTLKVGWERQGLGWLFEAIDYGQSGKTKLCRAYYGSSVYNTKQMARLIDYLIEDARSLELNVMSAKDMALLLDKWADQREVVQ